MTSFKDAVLGVTLALMALVLAGCGSSSNGNSPAPPPSPEGQVDFVSQSVEGTVEGSQSVNNSKPVPVPSSPFGLYIDADKMNIHVEFQTSATVDNVTAKAVARAIVNVKEKKVTYMYNMTVQNKIQHKCQYMTVKQMPDAPALKNLISEFLQAQPVQKAADGNKEIVFNIDPSIVNPKEKGSVNVTVELGNDNVLHKLVEKESLVSQSPALKIDTNGTMTATKFSAGAPDASKFEVDKTWGNCTEGTPPSLYEDLDSVPPHIRMPLKLVLRTMQIKPEIDTQSELIAI